MNDPVIVVRRTRGKGLRGRKSKARKAALARPVVASAAVELDDKRASQ